MIRPLARPVRRSLMRWCAVAALLLPAPPARLSRLTEPARSAWRRVGADNAVRRTCCAPLPALPRRPRDRRRSPYRIAPRGPARAMAIAAAPADFALERFSVSLLHGGVLLLKPPDHSIGPGLPPLKSQQLSGHRLQWPRGRSSRHRPSKIWHPIAEPTRAMQTAHGSEYISVISRDFSLRSRDDERPAAPCSAGAAAEPIATLKHHFSQTAEPAPRVVVAVVAKAAAANTLQFAGPPSTRAQKAQLPAAPP